MTNTFTTTLEIFEFSRRMMACHTSDLTGDSIEELMLIFMTDFRHFSVLLLRQQHDLDSCVSHVKGFVDDIGDAARTRESFRGIIFFSGP